MLRKIVGVILILGGLFLVMMAASFWQRGENISGMPAALPAGGGAGVALLLGAILVFGGKKRTAPPG